VLTFRRSPSASRGVHSETPVGMMRTRMRISLTSRNLHIESH
jgi:hypothetical protein